MTGEGRSSDESVGPLGVVLVNAYTKLTGPLLSRYDLIPIQWAILNRCYNGQADTVTGLARLIPVDIASLSRHVNSLVQKGLIRRDRQRTDRRVVRLALTKKGEAIMPEMIQHMGEVNAKLYDGLNEEDKKTFMCVIRRIVANSESYDLEADGSP